MNTSTPLISGILKFYILCFIGFGIPGLFFPSEFASALGYALQSDGAFMEFTGAYGGLILGIGAFLIYCLYTNPLFGLVATLTVISGLFVGRLYGYAIDGKLNSIQITFLAIELITMALLSWALKSESRQEAPDTQLFASTCKS